jgi:CPA2 family monovalent cation:H+ antiporter-2
MGVLGYFSARKLLGWSSNDSIYMASILAISSTTVTIKVLESLKLQTHRFAQTVFAVLIAEDLFAIIALIGLTAITTARSIDSTELLGSLVRLAMIVPVWFVAGVFALPYFFNKFRRFIDRETLILISGGLCFLLVIFANNLGYSPGLAAFVMGAILSETSEGKRISHSIGPLRDFFGGIFFVTVGMALDFSILKDNWITILSLVVILTVGKTVLVSFISMIVGLGIKSSVRTGFSLAQIGEFSWGVILSLLKDHSLPFRQPLL